MLFRFYLESTFHTNGVLIFIGYLQSLITLIIIHPNKQLKDHFLFLNFFTKLVYDKSAKICKSVYEKKINKEILFLYPLPLKMQQLQLKFQLTSVQFFNVVVSRNFFQNNHFFFSFFFLNISLKNTSYFLVYFTKNVLKKNLSKF